MHRRPCGNTADGTTHRPAALTAGSAAADFTLLQSSGFSLGEAPKSKVKHQNVVIAFHDRQTTSHQSTRTEARLAGLGELRWQMSANRVASPDRRGGHRAFHGPHDRQGQAADEERRRLMGDEDKEAQRRRALLHGAPQPSPGQAQPGDLLFEFYSPSRRSSTDSNCATAASTVLRRNGSIRWKCSTDICSRRGRWRSPGRRNNGKRSRRAVDYERQHPETVQGLVVADSRPGLRAGRQNRQAETQTEVGHLQGNEEGREPWRSAPRQWRCSRHTGNTSRN
jgi:hypothetical protein